MVDSLHLSLFPLYESKYPTQATDNFRTQWPNGRRVFLPTNKTFEGICLALAGKFMKGVIFVFKTILQKKQKQQKKY